MEVCRSQHTQTWLGVLYAYKGLLLVVGVYMAYETRHVKIAQLNDSQYIGLSVYSVVITSSIVVVLANLIAERVTLAFMTTTALIITSTTSTLCLLFVPKMHDIWGKGNSIFRNYSIDFLSDYMIRYMIKTSILMAKCGFDMIGLGWGVGTS